MYFIFIIVALFPLFDKGFGKKLHNYHKTFLNNTQNIDIINILVKKWK